MRRHSPLLSMLSTSSYYFVTPYNQFLASIDYKKSVIRPTAYATHECTRATESKLAAVANTRPRASKDPAWNVQPDETISPTSSLTPILVLLDRDVPIIPLRPLNLSSTTYSRTANKQALLSTRQKYQTYLHSCVHACMLRTCFCPWMTRMPQKISTHQHGPLKKDEHIQKEKETGMALKYGGTLKTEGYNKNKQIPTAHEPSVF